MSNKYKVVTLPTKDDVVKCKNMIDSIGNEALYKLCKEYPLHIDPEHIKAKIWLIGNAYHASLDRVKDTKKYSPADTYKKISSSDMTNRWEAIDKCLSEIFLLKINDETIPIALKCHKNLVDMFAEVSGQQNRSLASKYLHFHCPNMFYLYDSIACTTVSSLVHRQRGIIANESYDGAYEDYFYRVFELNKAIQNEYGIDLSPRQIDYYLSHFYGD